MSKKQKKMVRRIVISAAPAWSSWKARSCRVLRACWTPEARNFPEAFRGEEFVHIFLQKYD